jgi:transposase-like protein
MITETHTCTRCGSSKLTRNGKTKAGKQKFRCHACGCYGTLAPDYGYSEERKSEILRAYHERSSLRGLERTFGVARQTVAAWLKKSP